MIFCSGLYNALSLRLRRTLQQYIAIKLCLYEIYFK